MGSSDLLWMSNKREKGKKEMNDFQEDFMKSLMLHFSETMATNTNK
jgi:hypothetical protein